MARERRLIGSRAHGPLARGGKHGADLASRARHDRSDRADDAAEMIECVNVAREATPL